MILAVLVAGTPQFGGGGILNMIVLLLPLIAIFYFLMLRPQQKQMRTHKDMIASLSRGDTVITRGGMIGKVTRVEDTEITLEIAEGVRVRLLKETVAHVRNRGELVKAAKKKDDSKKKDESKKDES